MTIDEEASMDAKLETLMATEEEEEQKLFDLEGLLSKTRMDQKEVLAKKDRTISRLKMKLDTVCSSHSVKLKRHDEYVPSPYCNISFCSMCFRVACITFRPLCDFPFSLPNVLSFPFLLLFSFSVVTTSYLLFVTHPSLNEQKAFF